MLIRRKTIILGATLLCLSLLILLLFDSAEFRFTETTLRVTSAARLDPILPNPHGLTPTPIFGNKWIDDLQNETQILQQQFAINMSQVLYPSDPLCVDTRSELAEVATRPEVRYLLRLLADYAIWHKRMRKALTEGQQVPTLTWFCNHICGGIGDRLRGIFFTLFTAIMSNRLFLIQWTMPFHPELQHSLFNAAIINWDIPNYRRKGTIWKHASIMSTGKWTTFLYAINHIVFNDSVTHVSVKSNMKWTVYGGGLSQLSENVKYSFSQKSLSIASASLWLKNKTPHLHGIMQRYLFRVNPKVEMLADSLMKKIGLLASPYITVHIRTGFLGTLNESRRVFDKFTHQNAWKVLVECGIRKAENLRSGSTPVLLITDSNIVKDWAKELYQGRVLVTEGESVHIDKVHSVSQIRESEERAGVELLMMARSSALGLSTFSGFCRTAIYMCAVPQNRLFWSSCH